MEESNDLKSKNNDGMMEDDDDDLMNCSNASSSSLSIKIRNQINQKNTKSNNL